MKNLQYIWIVVLCLTLISCGREIVNSDVNSTTKTPNNTEVSEKIIQGNVLISESDAENPVPEEEEASRNENALSDEADEEDVKENTSEEEIAVEPKYITIDLSGIKETHIEGESVEPLKLKIISEEYNNIDWANDWYERENLSLPMIGNEWNHFYDDTYEYLWADDELYIFGRQIPNSDTHCLYVLQYPTDKWYVNGNNAWLKDGIFYGASVTNGYAEPDSCFMFAYDLEQDKLLWRSADQSYNSMNFVVKGDVILCGYGFTAEDDYLYQINRNTGEILDRLELKKMPDLLVEQDGKLYVHTYSYDYVIDF